MKDPTYAVQTAIAARLLGAADLTDWVGERVYDEIPQTAAYPLLHIGDDDQEPGHLITRYVARINAQTDEFGRKDLTAIVGEVIATMAEPLVLTGFYAQHRHIETNYTSDLETGIKTGEVLFEMWIQDA